MTENNDIPIVIYDTAGQAMEVWLDTAGETIWLTQAQMADLFDVKPQNITMHLGNVYDEGELEAAATCKDFLQVQKEGRREVARRRKHYNLDAIILVGYRINSKRATRFRQWATHTLREHLTRGWTLNRQRPPAGCTDRQAGRGRYRSGRADPVGC